MMNTRAVYVCDYVRTPIGRYGGALAPVRPDELGAVPLRELLRRAASLDPRAIDDVLLGCANQAGEDNRNVARMSLLLAGLPVEVSGATINRLCGSGLDAVAMAARAIASGEAEVMMAGGVESMSRAPFVLGKAAEPWSRAATLEDTTMGWRFINPRMRELYGVDTMPETAENVAAEYRVSRQDQDLFALRSQQRCAAAQAAGYFAAEIVSVTIPLKCGENVQVAVDEHPRPDTTLPALAKLRPVVRADGSVTAGNASGINDGACALLLASEAAVKQFNLTPRARVVGAATAGVAPRVMGMGPVPATRKLLKRLQIETAKLDVIELNEAFAAQGLAVLRELQIADDDARVNPNGGAIALGHPLGASGARLAATAIHQLERTKGRLALATMCIGVGQGIAAVFERVS
jgi:acetyl-CoA acyltransferase